MSSLKVTNIKGLTGKITVPSSQTLDLSESNSISLPIWTENTRPPSPEIGVIGYNSELNSIEFYNGNEWATGGQQQEELWYDEGNDVRSFANNWNYTQTYNMTTLASFGNSHVHAWLGSPRTYELNLSDIPAHTEVRYQCYIHMVDSWDNEYNEIRMTDDSNSQNTYMSFRKTWNRDYLNTPATFNGAMLRFVPNQPYSYEPWNGNNQRTNGYAVIDTNWQPHTINSITIYHRTDLNQAQSDEAFYISHSKLYIR